MRFLMALCLVAGLSQVASAGEQTDRRASILPSEYVLVATSGNNIVVSHFKEIANKLALTAKAQITTPGLVGAIWSAQTPDHRINAYFAYQRPSDKKPGLGKVSTTFDGTSWGPFESTYYPQILSNYGILGGFIEQDPLFARIYKTKAAPREDVFGFPLNAAGNPTTGGQKFLDLPAGSTVRTLSISPYGDFGVATRSSVPEGNVNTFFSVQGGKIERIQNYVSKNAIINSYITTTDDETGMLATRELDAINGGYNTSVYVWPFDTETGVLGKGKRVVGPSKLSGGPGSFDYDTVHFGTTALTPDGKYVLYSKPGAGCGVYYEVWGRKLNTQGGFAGAPFRPYGACNVAMGDGSVRFVNARSLSFTTLNSLNR